MHNNAMDNRFVTLVQVVRDLWKTITNYNIIIYENKQKSQRARLANFTRRRKPFPNCVFQDFYVTTFYHLHVLSFLKAQTMWSTP